MSITFNPFLRRMRPARFLSNFQHLKNTKSYTDKAPPYYPDLLWEEVEDQLARIERCETNACYDEPKVVIVGAGMAGLSAAHRLVQCGINDFTILEASERPGGRILSCWVGDAVAEMGPPWEPEETKAEANIYPLAVQKELATSRSVPSRGLFYRPFGDQSEMPVIVNAYLKFKQIEEEAAHLFKHGNNKQHGSLLNFMAQRIQQEVRNYREDQQYDAARIMFGLVNSLQSKCRSDLSLINTDQHGSYTTIPGGELRAPLGTTGALAPLLRTIPDSSIRYCTPVQTIFWGTAQRQGHRAVVTSEDGQEFPADYVILTVSVGVLRRYANKMFCPVLPSAKMDAFCRVGWGYCNKIFLDYARPFYCWSKRDLRYNFLTGERATPKDWTRGVVGIEPVRHSDHVLCARVIGSEAISSEGVDDKDVAEAITAILRKKTGQKSLPYPISVMRSRWMSDPRFCGSYALPCCLPDCCCVKEIAEPIPEMGAPIPPILLFAGEATAAHNYVGTVEGARMSGIREADRIVQLTTILKGPPLPAENPPISQQKEAEKETDEDKGKADKKEEKQNKDVKLEEKK